MNISEEIQHKLRCPSTKAGLQKKGGYLESITDSHIRYPIIDDIPVLIDNEHSIFSIDDFIKRNNTTFVLNPTQNPLKNAIKKVIPEINLNVKARENYDELVNILPDNSKILILGGSIKGQGMDVIYSHKSY